MARRGRPTVEVELSGDERETLERWARRPRSEQSLALRCKIVLACAEGLSNGEAAARLSVNPATVSKWRRRFAASRLDGLHDEPRPGVPRKFGDDAIEALVVKTLTEKPKGSYCQRSLTHVTREYDLSTIEMKGERSLDDILEEVTLGFRLPE